MPVSNITDSISPSAERTVIESLIFVILFQLLQYSSILIAVVKIWDENYAKQI